jgi:hypothetical protein
MMPLKKFVVVIAAMVAIFVATFPALGQVTWSTPNTSVVALGQVAMCLNPAGQAVACSTAGSPGTMITASSGNVAAATATATLAAVGNKTTFICGLAATGGGATAAAVVNLTVTNVVTGTMTYTFGANTGAGVPTAPLVVQFNPCVPANATNTTIVVSMPSLGTGNTNAAVNAWGFQL